MGGQAREENGPVPLFEAITAIAYPAARSDPRTEKVDERDDGEHGCEIGEDTEEPRGGTMETSVVRFLP